MPYPRLIRLLWAGWVAIAPTACSAPLPLTQAPTPATPALATPAPTVAKPATPSPTPPRRDPYRRGLERAASAAALAQSAQSQDDWRLVATRWQQAINLMTEVPGNSPNRAQAQSKAREYRRNLAIAQTQANRSAATASTESVPLPVVLTPIDPSDPPRPAAPAPVAAPPPAPPPREVATVPSGTVFQVPIIRRSGGTPVIRVVFNGNREYDMIVDTGASGTLITQQMAQELNVAPIGEARVNTASENGVRVPLGHVQSMSVSGITVRNVVVAIAGPQLEVGLLGHDFFGEYDLTVRQDVVEFRHR